jgi:integrase
MEGIAVAKSRNHHLIKRGDTWYLQKYQKGNWIKRTLSTSVTEARRKRDEHLRNLELYGDIDPPQAPKEEHGRDQGPLFGEVAERWAKIKAAQIKGSTMRDYRSSMNLHVLPRFGNRPIREISYLEVEEFKAELNRSPKRTNNILVPMRSVFSMAFKEGIIEDNVMLKVDNLRADEPSIHPLSLDEALKVIDAVDPHYRNCMITLFFTGLRFGELAALKWHNVDLDRRMARICETLVYGVEGRPKTKKSVRDIDLLPPVVEALKDQREKASSKTLYVFLDNTGHPLNPDHVRNVIWTPALEKAGIKYRPLMQTRHTFATLMLSEGENIGWIQNMLGHSSLQMIFTKYYSWIPRKTRNDGAAFMRAYEAADSEESGPELILMEENGSPAELSPNLAHAVKRAYGEIP